MGHGSPDRFPHGDSASVTLRELLRSLGDAGLERMRGVIEHIIARTGLPIQMIEQDGRLALQDTETGAVVGLRELFLRAFIRAQN